MAQQAAPDAGSVRQQIEQGWLRPLPARTEAPKTEAAAPAAPLPTGVTVTVKAFRVVGATLLDEATLQAAVRGYRDRPLGFAELQQAAQAIARAYRDAGWLARALLPRQDLTDGEVTIQVIEAVFAGARVEGEAPRRLAPAAVLARVAASQAAGAKLDARALERALLLADDLPGLGVTGTLEPAAQDGATALVLTLRDEPLATAEVSVDNHGARATGAARASAAVQFNSPLRLGDRLVTHALHTRGSDYLRLAYDLPVGVQGWRVGLSASRLGYRLVGDDFAALGARGDSGSLGVEASTALLRTRQRNVFLTLRQERKHFRNDANGQTQSRYRIDATAVDLAANAHDDAGAVTMASVGWSSGRVDHGSADPGEDAAVAGRHHQLRATLGRQQPLGPALTLNAGLSGQYARRTLDSAERMFLGGPAGVRAYPTNEGSGSRGLLFNTELRWRWRSDLVASAFFDAGRVDHPGQPATTLKGGGAALVWSAPGRVMARAVWATRVGSNPNAHPITGRDQDGSLSRHRLWLQISAAF